MKLLRFLSIIAVILTACWFLSAYGSPPPTCASCGRTIHWRDVGKVSHP